MLRRVRGLSSLLAGEVVIVVRWALSMGKSRNLVSLVESTYPGQLYLLKWTGEQVAC